MGGGTCRRQQRGAAAVEFALVAPLLLMLVFGIISYGYMLSFRQAISQAAAEGARAAAVAEAGMVDMARADEAYAAVDAALHSYGVGCAAGELTKDAADVGTCTVAIDPCPQPDADDACVTVTLDYDYQQFPLLPAPGLGVVLPDHLRYAAVAEVS